MSELVFSNINYVVNEKPPLPWKPSPGKKKVLIDVGASVPSGSVMAILGPSGAGKTSVLKALSFDLTGGELTGTVALNGEPLTITEFRKNCVVASLNDTHWAFLTCKETCMYAARFFMPDLSAEEQAAEVDNVLTILGLQSCKDVKCGNKFMSGLSGGQYRRLTLAVALLKKPKVLLLDEPTTGLDAAAAMSIMESLKKLAKAEDVIVISVIQQPSSAMFDAFDQLMVLSLGREAYVGEASKAMDYFASIGQELPSNTNPADFLLDLVNSDFVGYAAVNQILDEWLKHRPQITASTTGAPAGESTPATRAGLMTQLKIMLSRHGLLSLRDPTLYSGRAIMGLVGSLFFTLIYKECRERKQDQVYSRQWLNLWYAGPMVCATVVSVYVFNVEYKSIHKEVKNGMVKPLPYLLSRLIIEIPAMFLLYVCALLIPAYGIMNYPIERFVQGMLLWSLGINCFEGFAQMLALQFDNPLIGMMSYINIFFTAFLFGGWLISEADLIWPFKLFYYIMPMKYTVRGTLYQDMIGSTYDDCELPCAGPPVCFGQDGGTVLDSLSMILPVYSSKDTFGEDIGYLLCILAVVKTNYFVLLLMKSSSYSKMKPASAFSEIEVGAAAPDATAAEGGDHEAGRKVSNAVQYTVAATPRDKASTKSSFVFSDLSFSVKLPKKQGNKMLLQNLQGGLSSGQVLAVMGPSGAGKTTFINAVNLSATYGATTGSVLLDGAPMSVMEIRKSCFIMDQFDNHWPFLTCGETIRFASELYLSDMSEAARKEKVEALIEAMGLQSCLDTKCGNEFMTGLSGGQKRRLSLVIGLMKAPKLFFLDEPTSGLDSASAAQMMKLITNLAREENVMVVCTIHQPSSVVYNAFDELMLLSKGRVAYYGAADKATDYFGSIGHELPPNTNPADFLLDCVNADFAGDEVVDKILDTWTAEGSKSVELPTVTTKEEKVLTGGINLAMASQIKIMFKRHWMLAKRDYALYTGRMFMFMASHIFFGLVYIKARDRKQDQVLNRAWIIIWYHCINSCMGCVAVYAFNQEFVSIKREMKNGMVGGTAYLVARFLIEIPMMLVTSVVSLTIPGWAISSFSGASYVPCILLWAVTNMVFEGWGQVLAIASPNFLLGIVQYITQIWFNTFLFGGFLVPIDNIIWPLRIFAYVFPFQFCIRSFTWLEYTMGEDWEACSNPATTDVAALCNTVNATTQVVCYGQAIAGKQDPKDVLDAVSNLLENYSGKSNVAMDFGILICMALVLKATFAGLLLVKSKEASVIKVADAG